MALIDVPRRLAARFLRPVCIFSQASIVANPLMSVVLLAALAELFAIQVVLVLFTCTRVGRMPKARAAIATRFELTP